MNDYRYHGYDDQAPAARIKDMQRAEVAADVAAFLAGGGTIEHVPAGVGVDGYAFRLFHCRQCGLGAEREPGMNVCIQCHQAAQRGGRARHE